MYTQKTKILYRELPEDKPGYRTFLTDKKIYRIHHIQPVICSCRL